MRGPSGRGASRLARAGVLESTSSTASKRNEVMAVLSHASAVRGGEMQARLPRPRRVRAVEPSCTGCAGAAGGRPSVQAHRWRVLVANQVSEWPFGSAWVRKGRTTRNRRPDRHVLCNITDSQLTTAHYCAVLRGIARLKILPLSKCPRTVSRSRSASRRAPLAAAPVASGLLPLRRTQNEPMLRKGNVLDCVDTHAWRVSYVDLTKSVGKMR